MNKMSTGQDSTLGNWRGLWVLVFGEDNAGCRYLDKMIKESPNGENEEVIADEGQLLNALVEMSREKAK